MHPSLKAMAESKVDGIQKATFFKIDPDLVEFEPGWNDRDEGPELDAHIAQLEAAMAAGAVVPPIDVQVVDGRVIVRDGHCRTRAARNLKARGVTYVLEARQLRGNDVDMRYHKLGTGTGSKPLSPLEAGREYLRLMNMGETVAGMAARIGVSRTTIENGLKLAELPAATQALVKAGSVAPHAALKATKEHGKEAPGKLAAAVAKASAQGKKKATAKHIEPKPRGQTKAPPIDVAALQAFAARVAAMAIPLGAFDREAVIAIIHEARGLQK